MVVVLGAVSGNNADMVTTRGKTEDRAKRVKL